MEDQTEKEEWKYVEMVSGVLCQITHLTSMMPKLSAEN